MVVHCTHSVPKSSPSVGWGPSEKSPFPPWWGGSRDAHGVPEPTLRRAQGHMLLREKACFLGDAELPGGVHSARRRLPVSHLLVLSCLLHCWQQQGSSAEPNHVFVLPWARVCSSQAGWWHLLIHGSTAALCTDGFGLMSTDVDGWGRGSFLLRLFKAPLSLAHLHSLCEKAWRCAGGISFLKGVFPHFSGRKRARETSYWLELQQRVCCRCAPPAL